MHPERPPDLSLRISVRVAANVGNGRKADIKRFAVASAGWVHPDRKTRSAMPPLLEAAAGYGCSMRTSLESAEFGSGFAAAPPSRQARDGYVNPVLDADFPDPVVILAPDGYYYAYGTQTLGDRWINIQVARSANLVESFHHETKLRDSDVLALGPYKSRQRACRVEW